MPYIVITPNQTQSPGVFPTQANENFRRLQAIINAEHNFTDSISTAQGLHKQVTFINRASPAGPITDGDGILYTTNDSTSVPQLNFYNGSNNFQITPGVIQISSSATVNNGASQVLYADPGFSYQAYLWIYVTGSITFSMGIAINNDGGSTLVSPLSGNFTSPFNVTYVGHDLVFTNVLLATNTFSWTLLVTRLN